MEFQYITALLFAEGSEGPVEKYLHTMQKQFGFAYPLPLMVPLAGFSGFFPPDRVDREKLKALENLSLKGISQSSPGIVLELSDPDLKDRAASCLRGIHGKPAPVPVDAPFFNWNGILLHPADFPYKPQLPDICPAPPDTSWKTYRFGLIRLQWESGAPWWRHVEWEFLWSIRKAKKAN